jgi:hypothetical protein
MFCDALLFYYGITQSNLWLKQTHYFTALISTLMYLAIVAVYSFGCSRSPRRRWASLTKRRS